MQNNKKIILSIVIVRWGENDNLINNYKRLSTSLNLPFEYIIVNNGPNGISFPQSDNIKIIDTGKNIGFSKASNLGAELSSGKYLLFLNPDTIINSKALYETIKFYEETIEKVGLVSCLLLLPNGKIDPSVARNLPTPFNRFLSFSFLGAISFVKKSRFSSEITIKDSSAPVKVPMINGAFMLIRRNIFFELGVFDVTMPLFNEDVELCNQALNNGYSNYVLPWVTIVHERGESTSKENIFHINYIRISSSLRFFQKNKKSKLLLARIAIFLANLINFAFSPLILLKLRSFKQTKAFFLNGLYGMINSWRKIDGEKAYKSLPMREVNG